MYTNSASGASRAANTRAASAILQYDRGLQRRVSAAADVGSSASAHVACGQHPMEDVAGLGLRDPNAPGIPRADAATPAVRETGPACSVDPPAPRRLSEIDQRPRATARAPTCRPPCSRPSSTPRARIRASQFEHVLQSSVERGERARRSDPARTPSPRRESGRPPLSPAASSAPPRSAVPRSDRRCPQTTGQSASVAAEHPLQRALRELFGQCEPLRREAPAARRCR